MSMGGNGEKRSLEPEWLDGVVITGKIKALEGSCLRRQLDGGGNSCCNVKGFCGSVD